MYIQLCNNFYSRLSSVALTKLQQWHAYLLSMGLHIIFYNTEDMPPLDEMIYELQKKDSTAICEALLLHLLAFCDLELRDLPCTLAHHEENAKKVHKRKYDFIIRYCHMSTWSKISNIKYQIYRLIACSH